MQDAYQNRAYSIQIIIAIAAAVLLVRAMSLQLFSGEFRARAEATSKRDISIYPSRGLLYDRNGKLLTTNETVYDLEVTYNELSKDMDTSKFCLLLNISKEDYVKKLKRPSLNPYNRQSTFKFIDRIPANIFATFQETMYEYPGFEAVERNVRSYPHSSAPHALGYIREVNRKEVSEKGYKSGDYIGASGLESEYETYLKGEKGVRKVWKDNLGRSVGAYKDGAADDKATSGTDIITSLDLDLQQYGEELMSNKIGTIVAIEPSTGEILALISKVDYDPNQLKISKERGNIVAKLSQDSLRPFFNRAVMAKYPPGSIFKMLVGLAAMEEGVLEHNEGMSCPGYYLYNGRRYRCRPHPRPNNVGIALQYSCNTFFWIKFREIIDQQALWEPEVGLNAFSGYLENFGLGSKLGVDFPGEKAGNIPTVALYDKIYGDGKWSSPFIMSLGIGQGEMELTTLQMANMCAALANRGHYYTPHFIKEFKNSEFEIDEQYTTRKETGIQAQNFPPIIEGMLRVVADGSGRSAYIAGIDVAGKTGTVQNPHGADHSTFVAFAPAENPKIAVAVYVEKGVGGGRYAAPISGLIIEKYLNGEIAENKKYIEKRIIEANLIDQ